MRDTLSHHEMSSLARVFTHVFAQVIAHVIAKLSAHVSTRDARASGPRGRMVGKRGSANGTGSQPRTARQSSGFGRAPALGLAGRYPRAPSPLRPGHSPHFASTDPSFHFNEAAYSKIMKRPCRATNGPVRIRLQTYSSSASPRRMIPVFVVRLPVKVHN